MNSAPPLRAPTSSWLSGRRLALALALGLSGFAPAARADIAPPPPPPECVGKPDGTLCVKANGTAGQCKTSRSERRPSQVWVSCDADGHECDRLEIGAVCHGYLGKPAHCKEFTNTEKKTWRTCQVDGETAPAAGEPAADSAPTPSGPAPAPAAKKGLLGCAAGPGVPSAGGAGMTALWAAALVLLRRRTAVARRARIGS